MKRITKISALAAMLLAGGAGLTAAYSHGFGPGGGHGGPGWGGLFAARHIDGTVAFLKTELQITPQQELQWRAVEAALRAGAERMQQVRESFRRDRDGDRRPAAPERLARMEAASAAALESLRSVRAAFEPLYASMSEEQKKRADELLQARHGRPRR